MATTTHVIPPPSLPPLFEPGKIRVAEAAEAGTTPYRLRDSHGRAITDLRLSVTDRCNFRCVYCRTGEGGETLGELPLSAYAHMLRLFVSFSTLFTRRRIYAQPSRLISRLTSP